MASPTLAQAHAAPSSPPCTTTLTPLDSSSPPPAATSFPSPSPCDPRQSSQGNTGFSHNSTVPVPVPIPLHRNDPDSDYDLVSDANTCPISSHLPSTQSSSTTSGLHHSSRTATSKPPSNPISPTPPIAPSSPTCLPHPPPSSTLPPRGQTSILATAGELFDRLDPEVSSQVREVGWSILERFARVTQTSREAASRFLDHPLTQPLLPILPRDVQRMSSRYRPEEHNGPVLEEVVREFPAASMYLAQWLQTRVLGQPNPQGSGQSPLEMGYGVEQAVWEEDSDEESEMGTFGVLSTHSSLPKPTSKRFPTMLLSAEHWILYSTSNFLKSIPFDLTTNEDLDQLTATSMSPTVKSCESDGVKITKVISEIKERIFLGGIDHDIRPQVWKFLLGYLPWGSTALEQDSIVSSKTEHYNRLKSEWMAYSPAKMSAEEWDSWSDWRHRIAKDVIRTDRHHSFFASDQREDGSPISSNLDEEELLMAVPVTTEDMCEEANVNRNLLRLAQVLSTYVHYQRELGRGDFGYVQGMSDLCAVLLLLQDGSEVDAFWCFVGLMERLQPNFHMNQQAMHHQLTTLKSLVQFLDFPLFRHLAQCDALNMFFAFRWLLIWFKREYALPDVIRIWEVCLTDVRSPEYAIFVAMAMIEHLRSDLISKCTRFDEVLKLVNEMAENIPVDSVLDEADVLFQVFNTKMTLVQAAIRRDALGPGTWDEVPIQSEREQPLPAAYVPFPVREMDKALAEQLRPLTLTKFS